MISAKLLKTISNFFPLRRITHCGDDYLHRFYLLGRKPGWAQDAVLGFLPFTVYLHHFIRADADEELHTHPWRWSRSHILRGGYLEEVLLNPGEAGEQIIERMLRAGEVNKISSSTVHRISHLIGDTWTLFIVGERTGDFIAQERGDDWHFRTRDGEYIPRRVFVERQR